MTCPVCADDVTVALNQEDRPRPGPPPVEALEFFESKGLQPGFSHEDVWAEEHLRSFTAAKFMRDDVLSTMRDEVDRALREGLTFESFTKQVEQRLVEMGWWGQQEVTDPETGETAEVDVPSRLNLIFDTNMRAARAAGQWQRIERRIDTHPYLLYLVGPSRKHREAHLALHGTLLPADDAFWETHFPPNGYRCKCHVRQVSRREAARLEKEGIRAPEPEPVRGPDGLPTGHVKGPKAPVRRERPRIEMVRYRNKRSGSVDEVPRGIDPGFHRPPSSFLDFGGADDFEAADETT